MGPFYKDTGMTQPVGNCSAVWIQICLHHKTWRWLWVLEPTKWAIFEYFPIFQSHCSKVIGNSTLTAQSIIKVGLDLKAATTRISSVCHMLKTTCWQLLQVFNYRNHILEMRKKNTWVDYSPGRLESNLLSWGKKLDFIITLLYWVSGPYSRALYSGQWLNGVFKKKHIYTYTHIYM